MIRSIIVFNLYCNYPRLVQDTPEDLLTHKLQNNDLGRSADRTAHVVW